MVEQQPQEQLFEPGAPVWWNLPGMTKPAKVVRYSKTGQRIKIEYLHRGVTSYRYVMSKNLLRRVEST
jgi:hypothetical protein